MSLAIPMAYLLVIEIDLVVMLNEKKTRTVQDSKFIAHQHPKFW